MTAVPREVARKRPAQVVQQQPKTIEGRIVRKLSVGQVFLFLLLGVTAVLFAGFLLSLTQQAL